MKIIRRLEIGFEKRETVRIRRRTSLTEREERQEPGNAAESDRPDEKLLTTDEESDESKNA
jgi:hypothetical protein